MKGRDSVSDADFHPHYFIQELESYSQSRRTVIYSQWEQTIYLDRIQKHKQVTPKTGNKLGYIQCTHIPANQKKEMRARENMKTEGIGKTNSEGGRGREK